MASITGLPRNPAEGTLGVQFRTGQGNNGIFARIGSSTAPRDTHRIVVFQRDDSSTTLVVLGRRGLPVKALQRLVRIARIEPHSGAVPSSHRGAVAGLQTLVVVVARVKGQRGALRDHPPAFGIVVQTVVELERGAVAESAASEGGAVIELVALAVGIGRQAGQLEKVIVAHDNVIIMTRTLHNSEAGEAEDAGGGGEELHGWIGLVLYWIGCCVGEIVFKNYVRGF